MSDMPILFYSSEAQMAVADDPMFPPEWEAAGCSAEILILEDWQTYFVKFYGDVPDSFPTQESGLYTQRSYPDKLFEISFRNTVGRTRIGLVPVCIESRKISAELYEAMLSSIADKFSNLVFSFATPIGQNYHKVKTGKDIAYIEYLFLKKYLLDASPNLDAISALILANPHIKLYRQFCSCPIDAVTNSQPAMLINMFTAPERFARLKSGHPLLNTGLGKKNGRNLYPTEAIEERKHFTVDTNENRFVKYFLQTVQRQLNELSKVLTPEKSYLNPDIEYNIEMMARKIAALLADPLWYDVGNMTFIPVGSQVLQRREGYRQLFQLYSLLGLTSRCNFINKDDFQNILETKDTPTLFEYWSFFVIKEILDSLFKMTFCRSIVADTPLKQAVEPGLCIHYEGGILLRFNATYTGSKGWLPDDSFTTNGLSGSYSHSFRPDIVIEKNHKLLIFDAKFKGERGGFYGANENGAVDSCKNEDIDKMHCYREAIKGVAGAYIVYPGNEAIMYAAHNATEKYEGVGALPLMPDLSASPVNKHLENIKQIIRVFCSL